MKRYQLSLHAENLPNTGGCFRRIPSPYARVEVIDGPYKGKVVGTTEIIPRTMDPDWSTTLFLEFTLKNDHVPLKVTVYDDPKSSTAQQREAFREDCHVLPNMHHQRPTEVMEDHILMAEARFEASSVFCNSGNMDCVDLSSQRKGAKIHIHIQESIKGDALGTFEFRMRGLDIKNIEPGLFGLGRSDPFYEISKKDADYRSAHVKWNVIYRSEPIVNNLNPYWKPVVLNLEEICHGDLEWPIRIQVFDHNDNGKHDYIGQFETTIPQLQERLSIKGNADREQAIALCKGDDQRTRIKSYGLVCILKADVKLRA